MSEAERHFTKADLINLKPEHDSFVGIDSDGCVFPTMEIKQKQCFHGLIVSEWGLEKIEKYVRESAEFVNLYSKWRGANRFPCLVMTIDLIRDRPEVRAAGVELPEFKSLRRFIDSGVPLGNPSLEAEVKKTGDPELAKVLQWSKAVNAKVAKTVRNVPPFPWALASLKKIHANSDAICVSQTPAEALVREWAENGIIRYVRVIAGQELGTKAEHIKMAAGGKYDKSRILMIGDAPGDKKAAQANGALFYPINPGREDDSWKQFHDEAYDLFLKGRYAGAYESKLIAEFDALLPETPPWKKQ